MSCLMIADDNRQIVSILTEYAKKEGFQVVSASDGEAALLLFERTKPEMVLLDVMMPKLDGFEVCRRIRRCSNVPIIMITARGEDYDRIMGLDTGADDYIVKPFSPAEVMARIRAILRRIERTQAASNMFIFDTLTINMETYTASIDGNDLSLTKKELELLWTLSTHKNKVFTRDNLLDSLWGMDFCGDSRTVDSHIKRLRAKLDLFPHESWELKTIWGAGYKFEVNG